MLAYPTGMLAYPTGMLAYPTGMLAYVETFASPEARCEMLVDSISATVVRL